MSKPSRFKRALFAPANILGLTAAGSAAALTGDPLPALVAGGVEALYLLGAAVAPGLFGDAPEGRGRQSFNVGLLDELAPSQREHYLALVELKEKMLANHRQLPGGKVLAASSEQRVDSLLTVFLRLLGTLNHYRKYLNATDRRALEREIEQVEKDLAGEDNPRVREVMEKRKAILDKRLARFEQARESRELVSHQLAGIEDLLKLTHEQSIAIRDPESLGRQLDLLAIEAEATEETVRELERFIEIEDFSSPSIRHDTRVRT